MKIQEMEQKIEQMFFVRKFHLNWESEIITIRKRMLVIDNRCVNKNPKFSHITKRDVVQISFPQSDGPWW